LLQVEVTAFHRNLIRSSLWPCSSPYTPPAYKYAGWAFSGRPLTVTPLYGVRTFLPLPYCYGSQRLSGLHQGVLYPVGIRKLVSPFGKPGGGAGS